MPKIVGLSAPDGTPVQVTTNEGDASEGRSAWEGRIVWDKMVEEKKEEHVVNYNLSKYLSKSLLQLIIYFII